MDLLQGSDLQNFPVTAETCASFRPVRLQETNAITIFSCLFLIFVFYFSLALSLSFILMILSFPYGFLKAIFVLRILTIFQSQVFSVFSPTGLITLFLGFFFYCFFFLNI